jgi:hypothetical protein
MLVPSELRDRAPECPAGGNRGVGHQHGDRHRTDATGDRRYRTGNRCAFLIGDIAGDLRLALTLFRRGGRD